MNRMRFLAFLIAAVLPGLAFGDDGEWGHLSGRFLYDGDPPPRKTFRITKDTAAFGETIYDESLIVHEQNRGIANIVIYLQPATGDELPVHPSYADSANARVELVMQDGRFVPHILLLRTTQTMVQRNNDKVGHSPKIDFLRNLPM